MPTKVICIANPNGDTGKTTTAVSLAHALSRSGQRVLLIDLDPQAQSIIALGRRPEPGVFDLLTMEDTPQEITSVRSWMRFSGRKGLYFFPGDQETRAARTLLIAHDQPISAFRNAVHRLFEESLHYIIFDTAPCEGQIEERAVWASDMVIVPAATGFRSADGLSKVLLMLSVLQEEKDWRGDLFGILPTFFDEKNSESKTTLNVLRERFDASVLPPIHHSPILRNCTAAGLTIFEADPLCRAAQEYLMLTQLVMKV